MYMMTKESGFHWTKEKEEEEEEKKKQLKLNIVYISFFVILQG